MLTDSANKNPCQFAVVVSKKVASGAVARNKIRRKVYEAIRHFLQTHTDAPSAIFIVQKDITKISFGDIADEIGKFLGLEDDPALL